MNKSLIALAALGAVAGTASAADVQVYGIVDTGLAYTHAKITGAQAVDTLSMETGMNKDTRFGITGSEDLGNGLTASFLLENGFSSDTGELVAGRIFGRQASATLSSADLGSITVGRMAGIATGAGTNDLVYSIGDAFDGKGVALTKSGIYDNAITYQSPEVAGLQATVMYSFKGDSTVLSSDTVNVDEGTSGADRYVAAAITGKFGAGQFVVGFDSDLYGNDNPMTDSASYYVGANYDLGVTKIYALGQYFTHRNSLSFSNISISDELAAVDKGVKVGSGYSGWGLGVSANTPVAGGNWLVGVSYMDAQANNVSGGSINGTATDIGASAIGVQTNYAYPLSKRTSVYVGAAFNRINSNDLNGSYNVTQVFSGLTHSF